MKKVSFFFLMGVMTIALTTTAATAAKTGPVYVLEGLWGPKYSGAPSQALAGYMGLIFDEIKQDMHHAYDGKVKNPSRLHKFGYTDVKGGDPIKLTRIGEHQWRLKLCKPGKEMILKVVPPKKKE